MSRYILFIIVFSIIGVAVQCSRETGNRHYPVNIKPLMRKSYVKLPLGGVKATGWLKDQLQAQATGLTGHLDDFWPDLMNSAWRGRDGEAWERGPYYLDGLVPLAYLLEDQKLIRKVNSWIDAIIESRRPDGWFGPEKNEDRWPLAVASKVLFQYYEVTQDERALQILKGYFQYLNENPPDWPDDTWRGVRAMEHAVTGFSLFRLTKDPHILETVESIFTNSFDWTSYYETFPWDSQAVADGTLPLNWKADGLTAHVVNNGMAVKYPGLWYQQSKDKRHRDAVYAALEKYDQHHGQIGGRFSGDEHLAGRRPTQGTELCAVVEFMFSLENLLEILGDPALADRLEALAYNALPGTMTPDCWAHQYDQQSNQVLVTRARRDWTTNGDASNVYGLMPNYPCCLANMHQGWPKLVQHMWMATEDNGLAALVYGPNRVTATVGRGTEVTLIQETLYPFDGTVRLKMELPENCRFPLHLRIPGWAAGTTIQIGNKKDHPKAGTFVRINKEWKDGEEIILTLPMDVDVERRYRNSVAVRRGPLYFGLRIGKDYRRFILKERNFGSIKYKGSVDWEIRPATPWNYGLLLDEVNGDIFTVQTYPITHYPFADRDEMIFDTKQSKYKKWKQDAPVVLTVKARRIPDWQLKNNSADDPPLSPVHSDESLEKIHLVPYGCARIRISEFPVLE